MYKDFMGKNREYVEAQLRNVIAEKFEDRIVYRMLGNFLADIIRAVGIVIINKNARTQAIQSWTNRAPFAMFEDGTTLVSLNNRSRYSA